MNGSGEEAAARDDDDNNNDDDDDDDDDHNDFYEIFPLKNVKKVKSFSGKRRQMERVGSLECYKIICIGKNDPEQRNLS